MNCYANWVALRPKAEKGGNHVTQETSLAVQQAALREVRARYERGELSYEAFREAFDKVLHASDPAECQAIMRQLPSASALSVLDGLDQPHVPVARRAPRHKWMLLVLGELNRTRRPWRLGQQTNGLALVGEINLDLTLAALPASGTLRLLMLVGEVTITVPRNVAVTVHAFTLIGEARALAEHAEGIFAYSSDEADGPANGPHLLIQVVGLVGEVTIKHANDSTITKPAKSRLLEG